MTKFTYNPIRRENHIYRNGMYVGDVYRTHEGKYVLFVYVHNAFYLKNDGKAFREMTGTIFNSLKTAKRRIHKVLSES